MRCFVLSAALITLLAAPAFAGFGLGLQVPRRTAAPGENFELEVKVQNRSPVTKRVTLRMRLRGHQRADAAARRFRSQLLRTRVTVPAGEERELLLALRVPDDAAGAVRIEVRRGRDRRAVDAWVTGDSPFPRPATRGRVPHQPLFRLSMVREFDGNHSRRNVVIRDRNSLDSLLDAVRMQAPKAWGRDTEFRDHGSYARPVGADFEKETVLAIFAGGMEHVDFIRVLGVRVRGDGALACDYQIVRHRPRGVLYFADHAWAPYVFLTIPKTDAEIHFRRHPDARREPGRRGQR